MKRGQQTRETCYGIDVLLVAILLLLVLCVRVKHKSLLEQVGNSGVHCVTIR